MRIVFIVNNKNNRLAKVLPGILEYCRAYFSDNVSFGYTEGKSHAIELAKQLTEAGCDYLIAMGGDGTLHEVLNGVLQSNAPAEKYPVIGLLPMGSANDFARTAGLSKSIKSLTKLIENKCIQKIDLGKINFEENGEARYFANIAGIGLGPEVVQGMERSPAFVGPKLRYFTQIVKGFLKYRKKEVCITGNSQVWKGKLLQMAVANGRYYGYGICTAPDADLTDGFFQIAIFGDLSIWDYLKNTGNLKKGIKIRHKEVNYFKLKKIKIESNEPCGIEADGEYAGRLPVTITILPKAISFLMP